MAKANKQFDYLVSYYSRQEVENKAATQREPDGVIVQASSVTRAVTKFKRENPSTQGCLIVSVVPDNEGRYDVGPVTVDVSQFD